jgi:hypothetical protein
MGEELGAIAVATIGRNRECLEAELAFESGH